VEREIDENTICIVGSVVNYPHGIIDPIPELAKIALKHKVGLHVDACLGGFVTIFAKELGVDIPPYDFSVNGVTTISVDHHKHGLAPKGISVIMFKNKELRRASFYGISDWPGGLYGTPTM